MSPRPYQLGRRQAEIDEGRRRMIDAAKALLAETTSYTAFTLDAVAKRADVARATVYYQFGSKSGLLEALCDDLAASGKMGDLAQVFTTPDPLEAVHGFVAVFAQFWAADRIVMRRLRALAHLDPDVGAVIAARDDRNRQGLRVLLGRLVEHPGGLTPSRDPEVLVSVLHTLTSFETFDSLAGPNRTPTEVVPVVVALVDAALEQTETAP